MRFIIIYKQLYYLLLVCVLLSVISCSGADPVIYKLHTQLQVYWNYPGNHYERLLVQILADDDDGYDEIYEVYVIHDVSELYWRATKDEWTTHTIEGNEWIILSNIHMIDKTNLPRGKYRVVLLDFSGYRDEQSVFLKQEDKEYNRRQLPFLNTLSTGEFMPRLYGNQEIDFENRPLFLELAYPDIKKDSVGNININEYNKAVSFLGQDGVFYAINPDKPIKFILKNKSRVHLFVHYLSVDNILYSTGPFKVQFKE